jgi:hypothetical protein
MEAINIKEYQALIFNFYCNYKGDGYYGKRNRKGEGK